MWLFHRTTLHVIISIAYLNVHFWCFPSSLSRWKESEKCPLWLVRISEDSPFSLLTWKKKLFYQQAFFSWNAFISSEINIVFHHCYKKTCLPEMNIFSGQQSEVFYSYLTHKEMENVILVLDFTRSNKGTLECYGYQTFFFPICLLLSR